jgi:hypothetical protein
VTLVAQKGKADEKAAVDIGRESLRPSRTLRGAGLCRSVALSCGRWRTSELLRRLLASSRLPGHRTGRWIDSLKERRSRKAQKHRPVGRWSKAEVPHRAFQTTYEKEVYEREGCSAETPERCRG